MVLLVVLFTQAGLSLLHTHQGTLDRHPVAVQSGNDGMSSCQVCALDAVLASDVAPDALSIPDFTSPEIAVISCEGVLLSFSGSSSGRAPPVC
jgi:hypothetical protein